MIRRGTSAALLLTFVPVLSVAQSFENCTKVERGIAMAAFERSKRITVTAAASVGATQIYTRWFGRYSQRNGDIVRRHLKSVVRAMRTGQITVACARNGTGLCGADTYAFVTPDDAYHITLCPNFFTMATLKDLTDASTTTGDGTRAGTLIHEFTHFTTIAGTDDICYSREDCTKMAIETPQDTLNNADSYQYFVEDVNYFGVTAK